VRRNAPWVLAGVNATLLGVAGYCDALNSKDVDSVWVDVFYILAFVMATGVGFVLARRRSENPIGWLLLVLGLVLGVSAVAAEYATQGLLASDEPLPGARFAALWNEAAWPLLFAPLAAIAFVFPDGRLPSPRWRRVAIGALTCCSLALVVGFMGRERFEDPFDAYTSPLPQLPDVIFLTLYPVASLGLVLSLLASALAMRTRLKRATGTERRQIKLLAYAAALIPLAIGIGWAESLIVGSSGAAATASAGVVLVAIPLAIGVAVMRYRLYEVDRLINRTLVYVTLTALLAATYAAVSLAVGVALGAGSTLPTAAATLAVALAFGSLRARVQRVVDRRFDRARYEGLRLVESHLADLRAGRATPEETQGVLADALGDSSAELLLRVPDSDDYVDVHGRAVAPGDGDGRHLTPVRRGDLQLGAVRHAPDLSEQPDLLESVINAAGLAIEIARLRAEVQRRLGEVQESRARIVTAGYAERRRLERDLHDGAQQRLVSIGLAIRHVQGRLGADAGDLGTQLDATVAEVTRAIDELRELARGVRPACLDDGLGPALRELASRTPLKTDVAATNERFAESIEAAAYFVASEALTNAVKHANASRVTVSAERSNGHLVLRVTDDGVGGAVADERSGLAGITDRVSALGGSVRVSSPPGEGTAVVAELPCAS
jgi:signal transduction histidine kinase